MIKRLCDGCGIDLPNQPKNRVIVKLIKPFCDDENKIFELDLCSRCECELRRFLNVEKKEC